MGRKCEKFRQTRETSVKVSLCLDGGEIAVSTGIGFFDHMLTALSLHAGWGLTVEAVGDLHVDGHHTVEDVGIVLGLALREALGAMVGIERFGSAYVPMDEALGFAAVDVGGRAYIEDNCARLSGMIGAYDASLTHEFFRALTSNSATTLHLRGDGVNTHHITEAIFKAAGRAYKQACAVTSDAIPSTKGVL